MSLRDDILKKYGITATPQTNAQPSEPIPVSADGTALTTTPQPVQTPAPELSIREQILAKYADKPIGPTPTPQTPSIPPATEATKKGKDPLTGLPYTEISAPTENFKAANYLQERLAEIGLPNFMTNNVVTDTIGNVLDDTANRFVKLTHSLFGLTGKTNPNGTMEEDTRLPEDQRLDRIVNIADAGLGLSNALLSPLTAGFKAAEKIPVAGIPVKLLNEGMGKLGDLATYTSGKLVDQLPISDETKAKIKPTIQEISALSAQIFVGGKIAEKTVPVLKEKAADVTRAVTKDLTTKYNLPQSVYIDPVKVKDIFQTGTKISAEEADLVRSLGLDGEGYRNAIKNGVTIEVPAETIVTLADKPYWAKLKSVLNIKPSTPEVIRTGGGSPKVAPRGLLEPGKATPEAAPVVPGTPKAASELGSPVNAMNEPPVAVPPKVQVALKSPVTPRLIDTVRAFTPEESNAFGKKIIQRINEEVGTKISDEQAGSVPEGIKVNEMSSPDGRPAQFNNQGKIEIFLPDLVKDLASLAKGDKILAHSETPAYSKTYELKPGETMEQLAVRYVEDILMHEKSHEKTMTLGDVTRGKQLQQNVRDVIASGDQAKITAAKTAFENHMRDLEVKALEYERTNRDNLRADLFGKKGPSTGLQRAIDRTVRGGPEKKVTMTEKKALEERLKNQAAGAREGKKAGLAEGEKAVEATKTKYEQAIEAIKDRQATVLQRRTALIDYAQAFLPAAVRGTYLKAIRNTISEKEFRDTLERMVKDADLVERKNLVSEISKEIKDTKIKNKNGFPNVKFEIEAQRKLNSIRANINGDYSLAQAKIADLVSNWQTANPDQVLPDNILSEIQLLKMVGIKEMTARELRSVLSDIQSIKETGRTLKEIERFNRDSEIEQVRDTIKNVITGGKELPSDKMSLKQEARGGIVQSAKEFLTYQQYGLEEVLDVLSKFDKNSKPYESFLSRRVSEKTDKAFNEQNAGEVKQIEDVNTKLKEIYKLTKNSEILDLLNELQKPVDLGNVIHADGSVKNLTLSRGQAMQMEAWLRDPTLADTFTEGLKWGEEVIDTMRKILTPEDMKMVDAGLEFYKKYYDTINPVFSKEYGIDLPFNENYSPVTRNVEATMPENVLLAQEVRNYATAKNANLKARSRNNIELKPTDFFENMTRHIAKMEHYKAWSDAMFEFRRIFGNKDVRQAILDFHGKTALKIMDNFLNDFARDGIAREKVVKAVDKFRSNATKALLGLNWKVGAKQLVGVLNYGIELPVKDFASGIASFWSAPLEKARFLKRNSPVLQERFGEGFERDIKFAISKGYDKTLAKSKNFSEIMFTIIRNADKFTVYQGAWAAYRSAYMEAKKAGLRDSEAKARGIKNAEDVTNRVQESSRMDTLSPIQRGGSWAKLFTMFQSQPSKYLRIINNAARNYRYGRGSKVTNLKRIAFAWFVVPFIYNMIANKLQPDQYEESTGKVALRSLLGPLSYPLILGQMFQSVYGWTAGEKFAYQPTPVFSFMDDLQKTVSNLTTGDITEATTWLIDSIGKLSGVPTTIVTKPLRSELKDAGASPQGIKAGF